MKKIGIIGFFFCQILNIFGQENLIQNPSFEEKWLCPNPILIGDTIFTNKWWTNPLYFNDPRYPTEADSCYTGAWNPGGWYRLPAYYVPRSGRSAATFTTYGYWQTQLVREPIDTRYYTTSRLRRRLEKGQFYLFDMYVRSLNTPLDGEWGVYATDGQGAVFSEKPLRYGGQIPGITFRTSTVTVEGKLIENRQEIMRDTVWRRFGRCFQADGNEEHVTIGSFLPANATRFVEVTPARNGRAEWHGYYGLDDVRLVALAIPLRDTILCVGDTFQIDVRQPFPNATYVWENGSTNPVRTVEKSGKLTVRINFDRELEGCIIEKSVEVQFLPPRAPARVRDTTFCDGKMATLRTGFGRPNEQIRWHDNSTKPFFEARKTGNFAATITNDCGVFTDSFRVTVENCAFNYFAPNAFSPNDDGQNDFFQIIFNKKNDVEIEDFELSIFNRWGGMVFRTNDLEEKWNGRFDAQTVESGVYVWQVKIRFRQFGKPFERVFSGDVSVLK